MSLIDQIVSLSRALDNAEIGWALGGALALAYATSEPRATRDIDLNVFVDSSQVDRVFDAMPQGVRHRPADRRAVLQDGQVRLFWDETPIDLFFATNDFHRDVATRCRIVPFAHTSVRVVCAEDLAVFKALFDRPKDWVDIDAMSASGTLDRELAAGRLALVISAKDPRIMKLLTGRPGI